MRAFLIKARLVLLGNNVCAGEHSYNCESDSSDTCLRSIGIFVVTCLNCLHCVNVYVIHFEVVRIVTVCCTADHKDRLFGKDVRELSDFSAFCFKVRKSNLFAVNLDCEVNLAVSSGENCNFYCILCAGFEVCRVTAPNNVIALCFIIEATCVSLEVLTAALIVDVVSIERMLEFFACHSENFCIFAVSVEECKNTLPPRISGFLVEIELSVECNLDALGSVDGVINNEAHLTCDELAVNDNAVQNIGSSNVALCISAGICSCEALEACCVAEIEACNLNELGCFSCEYAYGHTSDHCNNEKNRKIFFICVFS